MSKQDWVSSVRRVDKPWGQALSLQYHERKEEIISMQSGRLRVEVGLDASALEEFELEQGEPIHLRPGVLDDVVRLEDRYGRQGTAAP